MNTHNFRTVGEFEKQESVLIIWPVTAWAAKGLYTDGVSTEIVRYLQGEVLVIICCYDQTVQERALESLLNADIDIKNVQFVIFPSIIIYPRDYGAEVLINDSGERACADFDFDMYGFYSKNHPLSRLLEKFSRFHAETAGITHSIFSRLISEGGDREFNGRGVLMTIEDTEVRKRNPGMTKEEVEEELKRVFNLEKIIWIPQGTYDDEHVYAGAIPDETGEFTAYRSSSANGHIDEMCRFVSAGTVLLASISAEEAAQNPLHALNKERLDRAYGALQNAVNTDGKPFTIIRMPVPEAIYVDITQEDDAYLDWSDGNAEYGGRLLDGKPFPQGAIHALPALSYCNFLIANRVVLAQKYWQEGMPQIIRQKDEEAMGILQSVFPDRKVIQIHVLPLNLYGGGIHCHTRNIPAAKAR